MTVGERIQASRKSAGLTQAQLAEQSGVAAISIHQYEAGKREPRIEQLQAIAKALGVSVDYLLSGGDTVSQIHLANGVHIFKDTFPFKVIVPFLNDFSGDTCDIVYQDEYLLIAVDKNSSVTKEELERIVDVYAPYREKQDAAAVSTRREKLKVKLRLKQWQSNKAGRLYMSIDSELLDSLELFAKEDSLSLEDEIELILHEDTENRKESENVTEDVIGKK